MALCIDEMAHMIPGESKAAADKVYEAADPSLDQFGLDGIMFLNSSPYTKVGMFYDRHTDALMRFDPTRPIDEEQTLEDVDEEEGVKNGDPRILTFQYPSWALFEGYQVSPHKFKRTLMASPDWDPEEVDDQGNKVWNIDDQRAIRQARAKESANPETYKVERRGKFAEVTDAFLIPGLVDRMYMGAPVEWAHEQGRSTPDLRLEPYPTNMGIGALNIYRYKFHLDPSSTTAGFGFAIAHTELFERWDGVMEEHVYFDLIKRWMPSEFGGKVIKWEPILKELQKYAEIFRPFEITFDQHQSAEPIQDLQERLLKENITSRVFEKVATNELNWKRWEVFKSALYAGMVHAPNDTPGAQWSALELKFLQENKTGGKFPRIDRQEMGPVQTKDMADCIAECTFTLIGNLMMNRTRDRLSDSPLVGGAPGGYGLGFSGLPGTGNDLMSHDGSKVYISQQERKARNYENPARGIVSRGRGRSSRNRARW
jgi:hypothetical protein